jgi:hypothetical protein
MLSSDAVKTLLSFRFTEGGPEFYAIGKVRLSLLGCLEKSLLIGHSTLRTGRSYSPRTLGSNFIRLPTMPGQGDLKKRAIAYAKARRPLIPLRANPPQGSESAFGDPFVGMPVVISGQPNVVPLCTKT